LLVSQFAHDRFWTIEQDVTGSATKRVTELPEFEETVRKCKAVA